MLQWWKRGLPHLHVPHAQKREENVLYNTNSWIMNIWAYQSLALVYDNYKNWYVHICRVSDVQIHIVHYIYYIYIFNIWYGKCNTYKIINRFHIFRWNDNSFLSNFIRYNQIEIILMGILCVRFYWASKKFFFMIFIRYKTHKCLFESFEYVANGHKNKKNIYNLSYSKIQWFSLQTNKVSKTTPDNTTQNSHHITKIWTNKCEIMQIWKATHYCSVFMTMMTAAKI